MVLRRLDSPLLCVLFVFDRCDNLRSRNRNIDNRRNGERKCRDSRRQCELRARHPSEQGLKETGALGAPVPETLLYVLPNMRGRLHRLGFTD